MITYSTNNTDRAARENIREYAILVRAKIAGCSLFGVKMDEGDIDAMLVAAFFAGKADGPIFTPLFTTDKHDNHP